MAQPVWNTLSGSLGSYPAGISISIQLSASFVSPATSLTYSLLSGSLPSGLTISSSGLISGTPSSVIADITSSFTIRATDNLNNIRDRTFSLLISGTELPEFTTFNGLIYTTEDSLWTEIPITYNNPNPANIVTIELVEGALPPGLEINEKGIIRGYPTPPVFEFSANLVTTISLSTTSSNNTINCLSTTGFIVGRPVVFSTTGLGGIVLGQTYYVKSIVDNTSFTISAIQYGPTLPLSTASGLMDITLPAISEGQPTIRNFDFILKLNSILGSDLRDFSIVVVNQQTPISQGGPGKLPNTRNPVVLNTRPLTFDLDTNSQFYSYYIVPPKDSDTLTTPPSTNSFIGTIKSGDYFSFKILGYDFDNDDITYVFSDVPVGIGLTGDTLTGWVTGTPTLGSQGISQFAFRAAVYKTSNPTLTSQFINFSFRVSNEITATVDWITDLDLGTIYNGSISTLEVSALADVPLEYILINGSLPPNLTLLNNGQITGVVAFQPTNTLLSQNDITDFTFTIRAYSPTNGLIRSDRTFTVKVLQYFNQPTDILYIKCAPSLVDRSILDTLLDNETLIPTQYLYRPNDVYFGKATSVIYEHAYGIHASSIDEYIAAVTRNHYWRKITLGELKTAIARDDNNNILYEVVYSEVIDNLINPAGISVPEEIYWPRPINLFLGPWYTSITYIYTSWEEVLGQEYYTSLTPGTARLLYPNSLINMRDRVAQELGRVNDSSVLPLWMTSQQENGGTIGFTPAWVICYTKPGFSKIVKENIETLWPYKLNRINFTIDRFSVNKSITYNYDNALIPPSWVSLPSATPVPVPLDSEDFYVLFPRKTILPNESQ